MLYRKPWLVVAVGTGLVLNGCAGMSKRNEAALIGAAACGIPAGVAGGLVAHNNDPNVHMPVGAGAVVGVVTGALICGGLAYLLTPEPPPAPKPAPPPPPPPPPPPAAAVPGHYSGTTADNELWAFDIGADGLSLTNLQTGQINESCNPSDITLSGGNLSFPGPFLVASDGSFTINATVGGTISGNPVTGTVTITGKASGGTASGTYREDDSFTYNDTAYSCTTGDQTWTASKT